tara:strand:- start:147 stop:290 length:144 start_codon:yes stop_codon:yes gene_type:complete
MAFEFWGIGFMIVSTLAFAYFVTGMELNLRERGLSGVSPDKEDGSDL